MFPYPYFTTDLYKKNQRILSKVGPCSVSFEYKKLFMDDPKIKAEIKAILKKNEEASKPLEGKKEDKKEDKT